MYPSAEGQPPAFQLGRLAMKEDGSWVMGDYYASIEPQVTAWNVAPYPIGPGGTRSISGYWPNWVAVPTGSKHPTEIFKYIDYLSVIGVQKWYAAVPDMPTNRLVPPDIVPQIVVEKRGEAFAREITGFFRQQAEVTIPMWDSPVQSYANDQIDRALQRIVNKQATPSEALREAQRACQQELERVLRGA
jgi:ABC-type glycerol-3-phosphate transport system substrate-binding protein